MAVDMFLKLDGIKGESIDEKHRDEIHIESFSWGLSNSGSASEVGKVSFQDFHFTKNTDKATPTLMLHCCSGKHIKEAVFTARKAGDSSGGFEFLQVTLSNLLVSSYQDKSPPVEGTDANGAPLPSEAPKESLSLNFAKIKWEYSFQNPDGTTGKSSFGWNIKKNQAF